jgi:hypothetical protein
VCFFLPSSRATHETLSCCVRVSKRYMSLRHAAAIDPAKKVAENLALSQTFENPDPCSCVCLLLCQIKFNRFGRCPAAVVTVPRKISLSLHERKPCASGSMYCVLPLSLYLKTDSNRAMSCCSSQTITVHKPENQIPHYPEL